jgi:pyruvate dehydrogenase E1 component alpha subunit
MTTAKSLIEFENEIASLFNKGQIRSPIHLQHGNENIMLEIFKKIDCQNDWVFCTWRNHYQALCKGIPPEVLKSKIIEGKSMVMNLPEYKFFCSSIVGGVAPIALGTALALKNKGLANKVWCFLGDMSAETGAFHEAYKYSLNFDLPITWVIEDNCKSVLTPTEEAWGRKCPYYVDRQALHNVDGELYEHNKVIYYRHSDNKYPHAGAGIRVQF